MVKAGSSRRAASRGCPRRTSSSSSRQVLAYASRKSAAVPTCSGSRPITRRCRSANSDQPAHVGEAFRTYETRIRIRIHATVDARPSSLALPLLVALDVVVRHLDFGEDLSLGLER